MKNKSTNNVKLGLFVVSGLAFLILMLYMIGRNRNLFQSTYTLKAHLMNAQGLVAGNNVRYAGIEIGTVQKIKFLNDTLIEVSLTINSRMNHIIRKNARVSVGSEGLVGNKVLNIASSGPGAGVAAEGDILKGSSSVSTDDMMVILEKTNRDIAAVAAGLRISIDRLNNSSAIWKIMDDDKSAENIRTATENVRIASKTAVHFIEDLRSASSSIVKGEGPIGMLLYDTSVSANVQQSLKRIRIASENLDSLTFSLNRYTNELYNDIQKGNNTFNVLLKDSILAGKLRASVNSVEKGTAAFTTNMEALKHNILFRGYFRKQEKINRKLQQANALTVEIQQANE